LQHRLTFCTARRALRKLVPGAVAAVLALGSASAFAWSGHGTAYTSRGTYNGAHYGSRDATANHRRWSYGA